MSKIITIVGPNASGKSMLGVEVAKAFNGEIISADSRQLYRGFDLCSGKISSEEANMVPHHMIDIKDIGEPFSVYDFQTTAYLLIDQIHARGRIPIIAGGTGLYVRSVVDGYNFHKEAIDNVLREKLEKSSVGELQAMLKHEDKLAMNSSDLQNKRRLVRRIEKAKHGVHSDKKNIKFDTLQLGTQWPKEMLHERIEERLTKRLETGMIDEVRIYLESGGDERHLYTLGLEYRHTLWYLTGKYRSYDEYKLELLRKIKQFAKRQMTWFRGIESIKWIDMRSNYLEQASLYVSDFMAEVG